MYYLKKFIKIRIVGIVKISSKKAPTRGTMSKAFSDKPYLDVIEFILAIAFGVLPSPWPINPEIITAASKSLPKSLKHIKIE